MTEKGEEKLSKTEKSKEEQELEDNNLKITALSAAVSSGFLSGFTSAANQVTLQLLKRRLTAEEINAYGAKALEGSDSWYVPTFLASPEGHAIADLLNIDLPPLEDEEDLPGKEIVVEDT